MKVFDYLRKKLKKQPENTTENVEPENVEPVKVEESEEQRIERELKLKKYHRAYIFFGWCSKYMELNGRDVPYTDMECFLADGSHPLAINNVIRLTGDNVDGKPIPIKDCVPFKMGSRTINSVIFDCNGYVYTLFNENLDYYFLDDHFYTGYELDDIIKRINEKEKNQLLREIADQEAIDEMLSNNFKS